MWCMMLNKITPLGHISVLAGIMKKTLNFWNCCERLKKFVILVS